MSEIETNEQFMFWSRQELCEALGVGVETCKLWVRKGAPKAVAGQGYPVEEFCRWLISKPSGKKKLDFRSKAEDILRQIKKLNPNATPEKEPEIKEPETKEPGAKKPKVKKLETGLIAALERARQAEIDAYMAHAKYMKENDAINTNALEAWQKTLEILRRCENDFTKVLEMRKELVSLKAVQNWMHPLIEQTKMQLLNIPSKLAPQLENLPWHEIQKKIDEEIRSAISKLNAPDKNLG